MIDINVDDGMLDGVAAMQKFVDLQILGNNNPNDQNGVELSYRHSVVLRVTV